LLASVLD